MPKVRVPLVNTIESRDGSLSKDSLITNGFIEKGESGDIVTKRPGLITKTSALGAGNGIFFHKGITWVFTSTLAAAYQYLVGGATFAVCKVKNTSNNWGFLTSNNTYRKIGTSAATHEPYVWNGTYFIGGRNAGGGNFYIGRSTDGLNWTEVSVPYALDSKVAAAGNALCDVPNGTYLYSSDNGATWNTASATYGISIASNNINFTTGLRYSATGFGWTICTGATVTPDALCWCGTFFWGQQDLTTYAKSTDGIAWTSGTMTGYPGTWSIRGSVWNGSTLLVFDSNYDTYTSPDGITWTARGAIAAGLTSMAASPNRLISVVGNTFIAVAITTATGASNFYTSTDGITWSASPVTGGELTITQVPG